LDTRTTNTQRNYKTGAQTRGEQKSLPERPKGEKKENQSLLTFLSRGKGREAQPEKETAEEGGGGAEKKHPRPRRSGNECAGEQVKGCCLSTAVQTHLRGEKKQNPTQARRGTRGQEMTGREKPKSSLGPTLPLATGPTEFFSKDQENAKKASGRPYRQPLHPKR